MSDIVFLHGATSGPATWDLVSGALAEEGHRVHALRLLGHRGAQYRPDYPFAGFRDDVIRQLDRLGVGSFAMVGHSLGGFVASIVAAHCPERVSRLVLEEVPVPPAGSDDVGPGRRFGLMRLLAPLGRRHFDPRMLRQVLDGLRTPQPHWWDGLPRISAPTLIVAGGRRSHLDQGRYPRLAQTLPEASLANVDVGHRVHSLAPVEFLNSVRPFLAESMTQEPAR
ncbi:alpha/beta fold hydrolase [Occultella kanbiaonis]|uniref:alpha/beta fold hydrolase n=1 Tax=Occultella kanbiaonis TaxID=2675754 RepID=UPI00143D125C|nr:alpha/beta fold hydrolase [Occultella kanbiaonis]